MEGQPDQSQPPETLGQLAAGIAHDYNNLLAVILGYAGLIIQRPDVDETVRADVLRIQTAAKRAVNLTRQVQVLGRRETVVPQAVDLNDVVAEVQARLATTIGPGVHVDVDVAPDVPAVRSDRGQLEQVLLNLAANAGDAMPDGGTLTITAAVARGADGYVHLVVRDTGAGMTPDVQARAVEPFFSTKPKGESTGLGLTTVHGIVADAGGSVEIDSEEGVGTTVTVRLPGVTDPATPSA